MAKSSAQKMADYRKRKQAQGLRQITLWVRDTRDPGVRDSLRREAKLLRDHPSTKEGEEFVEAALADLAAELRVLEGDKD
jgi:Protein  of unknown function (DUF3018)